MPGKMTSFDQIVLQICLSVSPAACDMVGVLDLPRDVEKGDHLSNILGFVRPVPCRMLYSLTNIALQDDTRADQHYHTTNLA
jgi:hypothetical protein